MQRALLATVLLGFTSPAVAGKPKDLQPLPSSSYVPLSGGEVFELTHRPYCVVADKRGVPMVGACASGLEAIADPPCDALLCEDADALPEPTWGLASFEQDGRAVWLGIDHAISQTHTLRFGDADKLGLKQLLALSEVCEDGAGKQLVTAVHLGCGKTAWLEGYDPAGKLPRIKDSLTGVPVMGAGRFVTDKKSADVSSCSGDPVVIAVSTTPMAQVCGEQVQPALVSKLSRKLADIEASPDTIADERAQLALQLGRVASGHDALVDDVEATRRLLTGAQSDLGRAKDELQPLQKEDDEAYLDLLTELERITTSISETFVKLTTLEKRAHGLGEEGEALQADMGMPRMDAVQIAVLSDEVDDLIGRGLELVRAYRKTRALVEELDRGVGFIEGQIAAIRGDGE